jgi:integrase
MAAAAGVFSHFTDAGRRGNGRRGMTAPAAIGPGAPADDVPPDGGVVRPAQPPVPTAAPAAAPVADAEANGQAALAVVQRLARSRQLPADLLQAVQGPLGAAVATAAAYAGDSLSPATLNAYRRYWLDFAEWCREQDVDPTCLPIHPVIVAGYLASLAATLGRSALRGRIAAIAHHHRCHGLVWSAGHPAIRETLRGIGRWHGKPVRPAAALTSVEVRQLLGSCGDDLAGMRDRALFLVGFAGAFRRSELVGIDHRHLRFDGAGVLIHLPRSKRDQEGKGADIALPRMRGEDTCPVRALERWLRRAGIDRGAVFRAVTSHGTLEGRLTAGGVRKILLRRAGLAKLTVHASERLSPHGLRAGFITEAYLAQAPDEQVMAHTRHADLSTMRGYRRRARITADNPARLLDL